ncbi:phosphotransferase [Parenemella sanctibonifatiensis]|uniref:Aminoglycoside phosphotransferase domain-containing protein n=1 Tax=Parenemella sanctibonifatiensis TaxID=2016505 RepID=A0A255EDA1_9ACTN|nr:phosphotransferase [Parenemella sanctibonifatiensis]OYN89534.1 hypothetical protein CGZ91_11660 [Parenemella sanctibonifatiensis]
MGAPVPPFVGMLLGHWGLTDERVRPLSGGTNNQTWAVGDAHVLRLHRNVGSTAYEHTLLGLIEVPFALPTPLPAADGRTVVEQTIDGEKIRASVSRLIPGEPPRRGDPVAAAACGRALADLDAAMALVEERQLPPHPTWDGDLRHVHPLVPDPTVVAMAAGAHRSEVARILARVGKAPLRRLPRAIIHGDFGPGNVLMLEGRVSGILDFETAGPGIRAMDLAAGLWGFAREDWPGPRPWPVDNAFRRGYLSRVSLTDAEVAAVSELQLLRETTSLVHWYGRHLAGLTTAAEIADRVARLLALEAVLDRH